MSISVYDGLVKCSMAFKLKDGNIILIDKEDVKEIGRQIIIDYMIQPDAVVLKKRNVDITKADMLYAIVKAEKDMKPELRNRYLKQIADLLSCSNNDVSYLDTKTNREIEFTETEKTIEIETR